MTPLQRRAARRMAALENLLAVSGAYPAWIECRHETEPRWAFVTPEVSGNGSWRVQVFDEAGFIAHQSYRSMLEAAETMIGDGYCIPDIGALDRCAASPRWQAGLRREECRRQYNSGAISFADLLAGLKAIRQMETA